MYSQDSNQTKQRNQQPNITSYVLNYIIDHHAGEEKTTITHKTKQLSMDYAVIWRGRTLSMLSLKLIMKSSKDAKVAPSLSAMFRTD